MMLYFRRFTAATRYLTPTALTSNKIYVVAHGNKEHIREQRWSVDLIHMKGLKLAELHTRSSTGFSETRFSKLPNGLNITKTRLDNFDPLRPHFYIVKLGFTGVYIFVLISTKT